MTFVKFKKNKNSNTVNLMFSLIKHTLSEFY